MQNSEKPLAVITGASSGIGYELARQFGENGFDLLITAENGEIERCAQLLQSLGCNVQPVQADLRREEGVKSLYEAIKATGRPVAAAALNAGIGIGGYFFETSLEDELDSIDLNCKSTVSLAKKLLPDMIARDDGKLLFTASIVSDIPAPYQSVYSATKAFVLNFAEALRVELEDTNITVTALQPGATDTNFFARGDMLDTKVAQGPKDDPADVARDGFKALMKGKEKIVAHSALSKTQGLMGKIMPDSMNAKTIAKQSEPGSAKH